MVKLKAFSEIISEVEIGEILAESGSVDNEIDFEGFLRVSYCNDSRILSKFIVFCVYCLHIR